MKLGRPRKNDERNVKILKLRDEHGLSYKVIAERMCITENTARVAYARVRRNLESDKAVSVGEQPRQSGPSINLKSLEVTGQ